MIVRNLDKNTDSRTFFGMDDLRAAKRWSLAQGPWGIQVDVVTTSPLLGEVLEVFAPATLVPTWRLFTDGHHIRLVHHAGGCWRFPTLREALLSIAGIPASSDLDAKQIFPE